MSKMAKIEALFLSKNSPGCGKALGALDVGTFRASDAVEAGEGTVRLGPVQSVGIYSKCKVPPNGHNSMSVCMHL